MKIKTMEDVNQFFKEYVEENKEEIKRQSDIYKQELKAWYRIFKEARELYYQGLKEESFALYMSKVKEQDLDYYHNEIWDMVAYDSDSDVPVAEYFIKRMEE